ncbi:MAG: hypothetical protein FJX23_10380, partial [Alphaproteobacteria bacterium]|nr:hypothetical protein [Alphaproteobacteria bacterium]
MIKASSDFGLRLGGQLYEGWTELVITRDLTRMSGEFALRLVRSLNESMPIITPGRAAQIEINGKPVL